MALPDKSIEPRILESAKIEFFEKGFLAASLESICKNAGVTTDGFYKRCKKQGSGNDIEFKFEGFYQHGANNQFLRIFRVENLTAYFRSKTCKSDCQTLRLDFLSFRIVL